MRTTIAVLTLLFVGSSYAGTINLEGHLTYVYPTETAFVITYETESNAISTCNGGKRFSIALSHPNYDALVSTVLAAHFADREVRIYVEDTQSPACAPLIRDVLVRRAGT